MAAGILSLPYQLLIDEVISCLDVPSILQLRQTCRGLQEVVDDEIVWRGKIANDFNFPTSRSARITGWQALYRGLANPDLYTWGSYRNGRLGMRVERTQFTPQDWGVIVRTRGVPYPLKIAWKTEQKYVNGEGIISTVDNDRGTEASTGPKHSIADMPTSLHAGGWSFYSLTSTGRILAWGSCAGDAVSTTREDDIFETPMQLDLGVGGRARSISAGREHVVAQLEDGRVVEWSRCWDRPAVIDLPDSRSSSGFKVAQIEAGWDFTAVLMERIASTIGSEPDPNDTYVLLWQTRWTQLWSREHFAAYERAILQDQGGEEASNSHPSAGFFRVDGITAIRLPPLPEKILKIAAGEGFLIALTSSHSVHHLSLPITPANIESQIDARLQDPGGQGIPATSDDCDAMMRQFTMHYRRMAMEWEELPMYGTDLKASGEREYGGNIWDQEGYSHLLTEDTKVTHISAQFRNFAVFAPEAGQADFGGDNQSKRRGKGIVILGSSRHIKKPVVIPELQGIQVITVKHGDWHSAALTQDGRVFSWGNRAEGALGTWDAIAPPENATPIVPRVLNQTPSRGYSDGTGIFAGMLRRLGYETAEDEDEVPSSSPNDNQERDRDPHAKMTLAELNRYKLRMLPEQLYDPFPAVRFGFPVVGDKYHNRVAGKTDSFETKYVFDIALAGAHSGALAIDRVLIADEA